MVFQVHKKPTLRFGCRGKQPFSRIFDRCQIEINYISKESLIFFSKVSQINPFLKCWICNPSHSRRIIFKSESQRYVLLQKFYRFFPFFATKTFILQNFKTLWCKSLLNINIQKHAILIQNNFVDLREKWMREKVQ